MITEETLIKVKNRSSSVVIYKIPETNIRREFQPEEVKKIPFSELQKLTYQQGGRELLEQFLQIVEEPVTDSLNIHREPEYNLSESQIKDLLLNAPLDQFLDALDFAPIGVLDLIKTMSVALPLTDLNKRKALKEKTSFDVDKAIMHLEEEKMDEQNNRQANSTTSAAVPTGRRTNVTYKAEETSDTVVEEAPTTSKYKVVSKVE